MLMIEYHYFNDSRDIEIMMKETQALDAFAALSQTARLQMVRNLVVAGADGLAAGAIAESVGVSSSSASFHLTHLERAGLVKSRRESRSIIYSANYKNLAALIGFLMQDCCNGHPEICRPASSVEASCCAASG